MLKTEKMGLETQLKEEIGAKNKIVAELNQRSQEKSAKYEEEIKALKVRVLLVFARL